LKVISRERRGRQVSRREGELGVRETGKGTGGRGKGKEEIKDLRRYLHEYNFCRKNKKKFDEAE